MKNLFRKNFKIFVGMLLGVLVTSGVVYADILYDSKDVSYNNTYSDLNSDNVSDAIDELFNKCISSTEFKFVDGYYFGYLQSGSKYTYGSSMMDFTEDNINVTIRYDSSNNSKYVCAYINNSEYCFKENNYSEEYNNLLNYFGSENCMDNGNSLSCNYIDSSDNSEYTININDNSNGYEDLSSVNINRNYYDNDRGYSRSQSCYIDPSMPSYSCSQ